MNIKNRDSIIEQLTEMLMQFDKDARMYQTDVYLYYDSENQTAELDTFVNVSGTSWLDDDHYTIYTDKEHYDGGMWGWYQSVAELAAYSEITIEQLYQETIKYLELDDDEVEDFVLDFYEAEKYLKTNDSYMEKLTAAYNECIDDMYSEYREKAEDIMRRFEEEEEC